MSDYPVLQRLLRPAARPRPGEVCDLCNEAVPDEHSHVVNLVDRGLLCACRPCYLLFTQPGAAGGRYRAVPDRYLALATSALSAAQWDALQIPVAVAFFFYNSDLGQVSAFYPSPAGATESLLDISTWDSIVAAHPVLAGLEPDVEALLVRTARDRASGPRADADGDAVEGYVVPIDACYELVGHVRLLWRGFDGGSEVHRKIDEIFDGLRARAKVVPGDGSVVAPPAGSPAEVVAGDA